MLCSSFIQSTFLRGGVWIFIDFMQLIHYIFKLCYVTIPPVVLKEPVKYVLYYTASMSSGNHWKLMKICKISKKGPTKSAISF